MIYLRFTFLKIIVIQPSGCKGNFNKTIYLVYLINWKLSHRYTFQN